MTALPPLAVWRGLPDPRTIASAEATCVDVVVNESWWHVVQKHVCNDGEPWDELLPDWVYAALRDDDGGESPMDAAQEALECLNGEVRRAMERPLVLAYCSKSAPSAAGQATWLLVLPCGARALLAPSNGRAFLKTCFFPDGLDVYPEDERWLQSVQIVVETYAVRSRGGLQRLPDVEHSVEVQTTPKRREQRGAMEFITPSSWGFSGEDPGSLWLGSRILADWSLDDESLRGGLDSY